MPGAMLYQRRRVCPRASHHVPAFSEFTSAKKMTEAADGVAYISRVFLVFVSFGTYDGCLEQA